MTMRAGLLAMVWLASAPALAVGGSSAYTTDHATSVSASVKLAIAIPRVLRMTLLRHPATVMVTEADIAHGEIVVRGPQVDIVANNREGFVVRAELRGDAFTALRISGLAREVTADAGGSGTPMPFTPGAPRATPRDVEYRLRVASNASPGPHPWPVALTLQNP